MAIEDQNGLYKTSPVKIVETGEKFDSVRECAEALSVHPSDISHHFECRKDNVKGYHIVKIDPFLRDYQMDAVKRMHNGCVLNGGVGSGKSRTGLYYYFQLNGGSIYGKYNPMRENPLDLYIITTARKRDTFEWEAELINYKMSTHPENSLYKHTVVVDSWNNIQKYKDVTDAFFIFDEQRVVGTGAWVKSFLKITKVNKWILLSATCGDCWSDYVPLFIANGFFKNVTEFRNNHVIWDPYSKFPRVKSYYNTGRLIRLRNRILVEMEFDRHTTRHDEDVWVGYDSEAYKELIKTRWNPWTNKPIKNASELCYSLRKIVNSSEERQIALLQILEEHPRVIIFYNFDYELEILKTITYDPDVVQAEWNGHKHQEIPDSNKWVYFVQYTAGAEGWNCIKTDTVVFYSQNYSYKVLEQSSGRIDRLNTPFTDLYYYHFKSRSGIDLAISKAIRNKKKFNEGKWAKEY